MVVNITERAHGQSPGYIVIYVTPSGTVSTIHVEGEGLSPEQAPDQSEWKRHMFGENTWRRYTGKIAERVK